MQANTRIGIIGLGEISHYWLNAIQDNANTTLVATYDLSPLRASFSPPTVPFFSEINSFLSQQLDCIIVATPPHTHQEVIFPCFEKGIAVILEKPIAASWTQATACVEKSKQLNVPLYLAYHSVFGPLYQQAKKEIHKILATGAKLTKITSSAAESADELSHPDHWSFQPYTGGGCLIENGINQLSIICDLVGELKLESSEIKVPDYSKVESIASCHFKAGDNIACHVTTNWEPSCVVHSGKYEFEFDTKEKVEFDWCLQGVHVTKSSGERVTLDITQKSDSDTKQVPMSFEYITMLSDAVQKISDGSWLEAQSRGILPFKAVMDSYKYVGLYQ